MGGRHNTFHRPEDVSVGMDWSLKNLGLDYGMRGDYLRPCYGC